MNELLALGYKHSAEYAPYNGMAAFWKGFREYITLKQDRSDLNDVENQAYDRGMDCARKVCEMP